MKKRCFALCVCVNRFCCVLRLMLCTFQFEWNSDAIRRLVFMRRTSRCILFIYTGCSKGLMDFRFSMNLLFLRSLWSLARSIQSLLTLQFSYQTPSIRGKWWIFKIRWLSIEGLKFKGLFIQVPEHPVYIPRQPDALCRARSWIANQICCYCCCFLYILFASLYSHSKHRYEFANSSLTNDFFFCE